MRLNFPKKIMIFGRPGSGKSTFAAALHQATGLPLYHLDKLFCQSSRRTANYSTFLSIQSSILEQDRWIIDGNKTQFLKTRYTNADLVVYFNYPRRVCYWRIFKRRFMGNKALADQVTGCKATVHFRLLHYTWTFEKHVIKQIQQCKQMTPQVIFIEVSSGKDLAVLKNNVFSGNLK